MDRILISAKKLKRKHVELMIHYLYHFMFVLHKSSTGGTVVAHWQSARLIT